MMGSWCFSPKILVIAIFINASTFRTLAGSGWRRLCPKKRANVVKRQCNPKNGTLANGGKVALCLVGHSRTFDTQGVRASLRHFMIEPLQRSGAIVDTFVMVKANNLSSACFEACVGPLCPARPTRPGGSSSRDPSGRPRDPVPCPVPCSAGPCGPLDASGLEDAAKSLGGNASYVEVTPYSCEEAGPGCPALPPESGCALAAPAFSRPGSLHSRLRRRRRRRRLGSIGQTAGGATRLAAGEVTVRVTGDKIGPLDRSPPAQGTRRRQLKQERQFFQSCLTQAYAAARCLDAVRAAEAASGGAYDLVVRSRADLLHYVPFPPLCQWPPDSVTVFSDYFAVFPRELSNNLGNMWEAACEGENRTEGSACGARRRPEDVFYYDGLVRRGVRGKVA
mmetsp:Transcript_30814/g.69181  ORF Transcript_30814/g.69181 Transcript_30814/m.69181 type:complete len:393 (-) Transcript_30814:605-1783(-)